MFYRSINWIISLSRPVKQLVIVIVDIILLELAIIFAYSLRQAAWFWPDGSIEKLFYIAPFLAIPIFYSFGLYQAIIRYMGIKAFLFIIYSVSLYMFIWSLFGYYINIKVPTSVLIYHDNGIIYNVNEYFSGFFVLCIITWLISLLLIGSSRLIARQIYWETQDGILDYSVKRKNVVIYGAGDGGIQIANALSYTKELKAVAFIDDNKNLIGKTIQSLRVYSFTSLRKLIKNQKISEVLIAIPSITPIQKSNLIEKLSVLPVKVSTIPGITEIAEGKFKIEDRLPINIEDILGREKVPPIKKLLESNITNKNILVTGAGGSIGSELSRQIISLNPNKLILFEQSEFALYNIEKEIKNHTNLKNNQVIPVLGNVCDQNKLINIFKLHKVQTVFHAAAYKHVPIVEDNIVEGFRNNVLGTLSVAEATKIVGVNNFVLISTDKAVRPTNIMGATKRLSEMIVQAYSEKKYKNKDTKYSVVRFGNVLGSSGSVLPLFKDQIESGGPLTLTHKNITRYFMTIEEAAQLVIQASSIKSDNKNGNLFILDMGKPIKILDLAKKMIELSGFKWKLSKEEDGDILIQEVGLRPGEKLFEELMIGDESKKTEHPKIIQIKERYESLKRIKRAISSFNDIEDADSSNKTKTILKSIVFDYKPTF